MRRSRFMAALNGDVGAHYFRWMVLLTRFLAKPKTDYTFTWLYK